MFCDDCKEQPAAIHLTQIMNGQKMEVHLCFSCASKKSIQVWPVPIAQPVFKPTVGISSSREEMNYLCSVCGYSSQEFIATGFLGCTSCYQSFNKLLSQVLATNQGNAKHQGKFPHTSGESVGIKRKIISMRTQLEQAIEKENFEEAARLRDEIHSLEQQAAT